MDSVTYLNLSGIYEATSAEDDILVPILSCQFVLTPRVFSKELSCMCVFVSTLRSEGVP